MTASWNREDGGMPGRIVRRPAKLEGWDLLTFVFVFVSLSLYVATVGGFFLIDRRGIRAIVLGRPANHNRVR